MGESDNERIDSGVASAAGGVFIERAMAEAYDSMMQNGTAAYAISGAITDGMVPSKNEKELYFGDIPGAAAFTPPADGHGEAVDTPSGHGEAADGPSEDGEAADSPTGHGQAADTPDDGKHEEGKDGKNAEGKDKEGKDDDKKEDVKEEKKEAEKEDGKLKKAEEKLPVFEPNKAGKDKAFGK